MTVNLVKLQSVRTALAVSALALLPVLSWQAMDARSSVTVAAPVAPFAARYETTVSKSFRTWSHTKSDRLAVRSRPRRKAARQNVQPQTEAVIIANVNPGKIEREITPMVEPAAVRDEYSDWLVQDTTGTGAARITDFASRRSHDNRKACRARHDAIVRVFAIKHARILADKPVMFQSSICTANGEIVITCFGTTATVSPRKVRPGGRCQQPG